MFFFKWFFEKIFFGSTCSGKNKKGNDGHMYMSTKNKIGICRWIKLK